MALMLRGRIWWISYKENGAKHAFSLKTTDYVEAKLINESLKAKRQADKKARIAQERLIRAGLAPDQAAYSWARDRWAAMNYREKQAVMFAVFKGRCSYCQKLVTIPLIREKAAPTRAVLDHRIPVSGGGHDGFDNIVLACNGCNNKKCDGAAP